VSSGAEALAKAKLASLAENISDALSKSRAENWSDAKNLALFPGTLTASPISTFFSSGKLSKTIKEVINLTNEAGAVAV